MKHKNLYRQKLRVGSVVHCIVFAIFLTIGLQPLAFGATGAQYNVMPPFLTIDVKPNVMFMLDNSGSMKESMYSGAYSEDKNYFGIFEEGKTGNRIAYKYDTAIGIDGRGFNGGLKSSYEVSVAAKDGAFIKDSCTPGTDTNCWKGNFLNWLATRKIDAARKVLVGGKVETRVGYEYTGTGNGKKWKIVGNNEPQDHDKKKTYKHITVKVQSLAKKGKIHAVGTPYDPYAKIRSKVDYITDKNGDIIGEAGFVKKFDEDAGSPPEWRTVTLKKVYTNDIVVVATPISFEGSDPCVIRISDIEKGSGTTKGSFKMRTEEWEYLDGKHGKVSASYLVIEKGKHEMVDGKIIYAGITAAADQDWKTEGLTAANFSKKPVIISSVISNNDPTTVTTRTKGVSTTSFKIRLQEEKKQNQAPAIPPASGGGDSGVHTQENIAYIALDKGTYSDGLYSSFLQVGIQKDVTDAWNKIVFTTDAWSPFFLASIQTFNDSDPAGLRYKKLNATDVEVFVEEEKSDGTDPDHGKEDVGYVIIGRPEYNLALLVDKEPKGLLHDVANKVRLGISFYNYNKQSDNIYKDEWFHGGTMRLSIPKNPFVKKPTDTDGGGYRTGTVDTYVNAGIDKIVDAIEHYPLVWGTTPLAENFYEVVRYFQQADPYYNDAINTGDSSYINGYEKNNDWDPYFVKDPNGDGRFNDSQKVGCAQSYVLLFTDGESFRDDYLPCYNSTNDTYDPSLAAAARCTDYDGNHTGGEGFNKANKSNKYRNNLDDIVGWAYETKTGIDRDLRTDTGMDDKQNIITYTVEFGSDKIPDILQDSADNGGGEAYAAESGRELKDKLSEAFLNILNKRSSGTAASVISNARSGEGAIYQSVFFPGRKQLIPTTTSYRKISWAGQVHSLLIDGFGNIREDTTEDHQLDIDDDFIVVFNNKGTAYRFKDNGSNGHADQKLDGLTPAGCKGKSCNKCSADDTIDCLVDHNYSYGTITPVNTPTNNDEEIQLDDLKYLWNSTRTLNEINNNLIAIQRSEYISDSQKRRYIFTWVDADKDGLVDQNAEVKDFTSLTVPTEADLTDPTTIYPYLNVYNSYDNTPTYIKNLSSADFLEFLKKQSRREINYIRGSDCADSSHTENCNTRRLKLSSGTTVSNSEMRKRAFDYDGDGTVETWRLGDIVDSTPTVVSRPFEAYHLLYRDKSYAQFAAHYQNRRSVVYVGANDGMVHAFNGGFYQWQEKRFCEKLNPDYEPNDTTKPACLPGKGPELGAELWAYVPYNLLPHLYWLTQSAYSAKKHIYYVDQKPRIFEARIFSEDTDHPKGWGTVLVVGMRFGGGTIMADMDKQSTSCLNGDTCSVEKTCSMGGQRCSTELSCAGGITCLNGAMCSNSTPPAPPGNIISCLPNPPGCATGICINMNYCADSSTCEQRDNPCANPTDCKVYTCTDGSACEERNLPDAAVDRTMKSAFVLFDITNPEKKPVLMAEIPMPKGGFTTSYPTVIAIPDGNKDKNYKDPAGTIQTGENKWFLAFGSGPADSNGDPGTFNTVTGEYDKKVLEEAGSSQKAQFYLLDLVKLAQNNEFWSLTDTGSGASTKHGVLVQGLHSYAALDTNAFVSVPITVDYDLDYNDDALYFGTISGSVGSWAGKMRRIVVDDDNDTEKWIPDSTLIDVQHPVSTAATVGVDDDGKNWLYFGTGRYFTVKDKADKQLQSYYGVKEPVALAAPHAKTWEEVSAPAAGRPNGPNAPVSPLTESLVNVTHYQVFANSDVSLYHADHTQHLEKWSDLLTQQSNYSGWYLDFDGDKTDDTSVTADGERSITRGILLGGLVSFTTFIPDSDVCKAGGMSDLWALFYKTGTAHYNSILGTSNGYGTQTGRTDKNQRSLGDQADGSGLLTGMASSPSAHTGGEEGMTITTNLSTGETPQNQVDTPIKPTSGMRGWRLK